MTAAWLGHTTVLLNVYGFHILTDPALGSRVGVSLGLGTAGPKRYIAPALTAGELPRIDLVLLSHAHMDHMDLPTLARISPQLIVTAAETRDVLSGLPCPNVVEMRWGQREVVRNGAGELAIEAVEVKHWGQRWPSEAPRGYNGYVLRREGKALFFAGDTAMTDRIPALRPQGPFELAVMPIGAYQPWIRNHCNPEQAVQMALQAGARYILPVHHQTFKLSDEPFTEPIERTQEALRLEPERLALRQIGETFVCPA